MNFRTPYLVGLIASVLLILVTSSVQQTVFAAEKLKITGPDGEVRQTISQYGPTRTSDTFWSISQKMQPDASVSIYQVMGAIYDANPHAFSSANYNSLEKGMILLIPSKESMLAIPKSLAKQLAERNDAGWKKLTAKPVVAVKPIPPKADTASIEEASTPAVNAKVDNSQMAAELAASQDKNLQLTDALGRAQDELNVSGNDIALLTDKVDGLNEEIAILQEQLLASRLKNESLSADVEALKERLTQIELPVQQEDLSALQEDGIKWSELMTNPLTLILGTAVPAFIFLIVLWLFLRRRRSEGEQNEGEPESPTVQNAPESVPELDKASTDDLDDMVVHLDSEEDSLDSLMSVDSAELQPEVEMEIDSEPMDMASDMFVDPGEDVIPEETGLDGEVEDEGQSLDDLWAEAMGEQEDDEDLDSLLDGIGELEDDNLNEKIAAELEADATDKGEEAGDESDLDSLMAEFDMPTDDSVDDNFNEEIAADVTDKSEEQDDEADLDSLLAEFDEPENEPADDSADDNLNEEIAAELAADEIDKGEEQVDEADLDSLLAEFDEPENEPADDSADDNLNEEIAAELAADVELGEEQVDDADLDALLAGFDEPADDSADDNLNEEIAAELAADVDLGEEQVDDADLDALLAGFDEPPGESAGVLNEEFAAESLLEVSDLEGETSDQSGEGVDEALDTLLADLESVEQESNSRPESIKEENFFADLKGNKHNIDNSVEWDGELANSVEDRAPLPDESTGTIDSSEDLIDEDLDLDLSTDEGKITVDEALAALDAQESVDAATSNKIDEHDLTSFQKDNGFIDIDRLLNEADEEDVELDQYKELDVDMGELDSLMGNAAMVDVDDEENSVNAKLDLARAYIEIDDNDSAISLLQEVKLDGNDNQKQEAEGLISSLT